MIAYLTNMQMNKLIFTTSKKLKRRLLKRRDNKKIKINSKEIIAEISKTTRGSNIMIILTSQEKKLNNNLVFNLDKALQNLRMLTLGQR